MRRDEFPKEDGPQTKSQRLPRPVVHSYGKSDCPRPVMGKNSKNFLQPAVVAATVYLRVGELLPTSLGLPFGNFPVGPRDPPFKEGQAHGQAAGVQQAAASRVGTRPGPLGRAQKPREPEKGRPNHWATEILELVEDTQRFQPVQSFLFAAGTPKPAEGRQLRRDVNDRGEVDQGLLVASYAPFTTSHYCPPSLIPSLPQNGQVSNEGTKRR